MTKKVVIFAMIGTTVALIGLATVSLATADWVHANTIQCSLGLWQFCELRKCEVFPFQGQ